MVKMMVRAGIGLFFLLLAVGTTLSTSAQSGSLPLILDMVHDNPGEAPYESQFNDPGFLKERGFNGKVFFLFKSAQLGVDWSVVDPELMPAGSPERKWVDQKAAQLHELYSEMKDAGVKVYCMSDLILFPKCVIEKYGLKEGMGDPKNPLTEKYLLILLREMFSQFPQLDGIVVRIGETYLHDAPYHAGDIDDKGNAEECIIPLMNILRDEVCVKLNKQVVFRTWWSFDTSLNTYNAVNEAVEPHENLTISIKHCEGDFHRGNPFSKVLGVGRHKQLVEVQSAREYEGKGAYPNYIGKGVIDGFVEHESLREQGKPASLQEIYDTGKLTGMWTWSRGGGWEGPYIQNELWCDLNTYVMAQWANNPQEAEESIFNRYALAELGLDKGDAAKFRRLALLSADAVILGRRSRAYFNDMEAMWTRDEFIGFPRMPKDIDKVRVILSEKDQAIEAWEEICQLAREIRFKDDATGEFVRVTADYGRELYRIYRAVLYLSAIDKNLFSASEMEKWIAEYDAAWAAYQELGEKHPGCPTLYSKTKAHRMYLKAADGEINRMRAEMKMGGRMMFGDTFRDGVPFAKDPYVIRFNGRYLMYYSVRGYTDQEGNAHGWGIGIAESMDLINWKRMGEVNTDLDATYEAKGFAAPCALVVNGMVHLFYQTYGNGAGDAICHAWSTDGLKFTRNKTNPIFRPTGSWNCGRAIDAEVVPFEGKYFLYYATRDPGFKIQMQGVAVASGDAGFNREDWTDLSMDGPMLKPELPWERDCIEAASVINRDGELFMFYAGGYNNAPQQIGVAKSSDGIKWVRLFDHPFLPNGKPGEWNSCESGHPHIFSNPDGDDYLFFQGNNDHGRT